MTRYSGGLVLGLALLTWLGTGAAAELERVTVTVRALFEQRHRIELTAGGEVVWDDPHFERIWFPAGRETPKVDRLPAGGFRATFPRPGIYKGAVTVTGGHGTNDVYEMTVIVKPARQ